MRIAYLGWGSLIKEPGQLPIVGHWKDNGPKLCIEFSRISKGVERRDCLTLVIDERYGSEVVTHSVSSACFSLEDAVIGLGRREGTPIDNIGFCEVAGMRFASKARERHPDSCKRVYSWAVERNFDAVVWTSLARRFKDVLGIPFSPKVALEYLNRLPQSTKERAFHYIHNAPIQTMTPFRELFLAQHASSLKSIK